MSAGGVIVGGGLDAVAFTVALLLLETESVVAELTVTVFGMIVPSATEQLTEAIIVTVADALAASEVKLTARLFPEPPQVPPPVASHETKVILAGRLSVSVIDCATPGPLFVTLNE